MMHSTTSDDDLDNDNVDGAAGDKDDVDDAAFYFRTTRNPFVQYSTS